MCVLESYPIKCYMLILLPLGYPLVSSLGLGVVDGLKAEK